MAELKFFLVLLLLCREAYSGTPCPQSPTPVPLPDPLPSSFMEALLQSDQIIQDVMAEQQTPSASVY